MNWKGCGSVMAYSDILPQQLPGQLVKPMKNPSWHLVFWPQF